MLEHADGDDAVEWTARVAIILEPEINQACEALFDGPLLGGLELFGAERYARDMHAVVAGEEQSHTAEPAADIEHAVSGPQIELGCNVPLLGFLSLLE